MPICEYCGNEHDGSYGSGRFCGASCRAKYADSHISKETRQIRANTAAETRKRHLKELLASDKFQKNTQ